MSQSHKDNAFSMVLCFGKLKNWIVKNKIKIFMLRDSGSPMLKITSDNTAHNIIISCKIGACQQLCLKKDNQKSQKI